MKNIYVLLAIGLLCVGAAKIANAQYSEKFDSYTPNAIIGTQSSSWVGWGGEAMANCLVSTAQAHSGTQSLAAVGGAGTDQCYVFGTGPTEGYWEFSTMTYVPSAGKAGETYFNLMNYFDDPNETYQWSVVGVHWMMTAGNAKADKVYNDNTPAGEELDIIYDTWVEVSANIDLDNNTCEIFYDGTSLGEPAAWTDEVERAIQVMDIFPISADASVIYYDDIWLSPPLVPWDLWDLNKDGIIDDSDLNILLSDFENPPSEQNNSDLDELLKDFGKTDPESIATGTQSVPEPGSLSLLIFAGLFGFCLRRRK